MSFISEIPITLEPIDASTSSKIDSGIVSATVDLEIENAIPLNGTVDMIISNSQFFPLIYISLNLVIKVVKLKIPQFPQELLLLNFLNI